MNPFINQNEHILESYKDIFEFDNNQMENNIKKLKIGAFNVFVKLSNFHFDSGLKFLRNSSMDLNSLRISPDELSVFFNKLIRTYSVDKNNISIELRTNFVKDIRPDHLRTIFLDYNNTVKKVLSGEMTKEAVKKKYSDTPYFENIKKKMVKTSEPIRNIKDLLYLKDNNIVQVTNFFISDFVLSFLSQHEMKVKELNTTFNNVNREINTTYMDVKNVITSLVTLYDAGELDEKTTEILVYTSYLFIYNFNNIVNYLIALTIRRLSEYSYNSLAIYDLEDTINRFMPETVNLKESAGFEVEDIINSDDDQLLKSMLSGDLTFIIPTLRSIIGLNKSKLSSLIASKYDIKNLGELNLDDLSPYDLDKYIEVRKDIETLNSVLSGINEVTDFTLPADDIVTKLGLHEGLFHRMEENLIRLTDMRYYLNSHFNKTDPNSRIEISLYNDINNFEENVFKISSSLKQTDEFFNKAIETLSVQTDNESDNFTRADIVSILNQTRITFNSYVVKLVRKLMERLNSLSDTLSEMDNLTTDVKEPIVEGTECQDYSEIYYRERFEELKNEFDNNMERLNIIYTEAKINKTLGVKLILENTEKVADKNDKGNQEKTDNQENKSTTSVETKTDSTSKTNPENKEDVDKTSQEKKDSKFKEIVESLRKWFVSLMEKFRNNSKRIVTEGAISKLKSEEKRKFFENFNDVGGSVTVIPYSHVNKEDITNIVTKATNSIKAIDVNNAKNRFKSKEILFKHIFSGVPYSEQTGETVKNYLFYDMADIKGKDVYTKYTGDDYVKKIKGMYEWVMNYESLSNELNNILKPLTDAASEKEAELRNSNKEAENTNGTNNDSFKLEGQIVACVKDVTYSICTTLEKKALDYANELNKINTKK